MRVIGSRIYSFVISTLGDVDDGMLSQQILKSIVIHPILVFTLHDCNSTIIVGANRRRHRN